jgi:tetrahydromethanopterin S-methyltransferase subunit F
VLLEGIPMVLIVLIVLWSIVLIPPAWQSHAEARRARQVDAFRRKLEVLAPAPDTPLARRPVDAARPFEAARPHVAVVAPRNVVPLPVAEAEPVDYETDEVALAAAAAASLRRVERVRTRADVLRRRQRVLMGLMAAAVVSLAGAFVLDDVRAWAVHGLVVTVFAAYLVALRRLKKLALERKAKVRYFPAAPAPADERQRLGAGVR